MRCVPTKLSSHRVIYKYVLIINVAGQTGKQAVTKKHVLVMDEVDGMAGNEDRGMDLLVLCNINKWNLWYTQMFYKLYTFF